ncbi:hypothetical protein JCM11251_006999 [Rhodosporidiobolus azoricus]
MDASKTSAPSKGNTTDTNPTPSSLAPANNATKKTPNSSSSPANPGSPARQRSGGPNDRRRSSSKGAGTKNQNQNQQGDDASPSTPAGGEKKPPQQQQQGQQHGRRQSRGGGSSGGNRRGSGGAQQQKKEGAPTSGGASVPSETLSNLKSLISDLRETAPPTGSSASAGGSPSSGSAPASPGRSRQGGHRKNTSSHAGSGAGNIPPSISAPPPAPSSGHSTLNPAAGGFLPHLQPQQLGGGGVGGMGSLGPIHDMIDEGLVTPTASRFDLMTGVPLPHSPPLGGAFPEEGAGFGGVGGMNARGFTFPQPQQAQQLLQQQQQQLLQQHQQQQFQLAQLAGLSAAGANPAFGVGAAGGTAFGGASGGGDASELIAEQLAIQQQLAALKVQQESLMARFGDMQANLVQQAQHGGAGTGAPSPQQQQQHRRNQSAQLQQQQQQASGAMGSFGTNAAFQHAIQGVQQQQQQVGTSGSPQQQKQAAHGRRPSAQENGPAGGGGRNGGFGSGFSFPPKPQGHQSTPSRSGGGFMDEAEVSGGWGVSDSPQQQGQGQGRGFERGQGHHRRQSGSVSSLGGWSMNMNQPANSAPLAEAQAHLAQLSLYRASSGHARVPSFGMSSIGPNGQGGPGQLAMAGYGGGLPMAGGGGGGPGGMGAGRKTLFAPYLPQASIPPLLQAGKLVIGTLRVNKRNRSDAYVATDVLDSDIYICGSKDRNRALEGDIVAVELLDVDEVWGTKKDKEEKKRKKEEQASYDPRAARDIRKQDKKKDDVEVEGQGLLLFEEEEVNDEQKPQFAGHVVAVLERAPGQLFSGTLGVLRPSSAATQQKQDAERREREGVDLRGGGGGGGGQNGSGQPAPKIIWFRPTDKRVPLIAIPTEQAPADFVDHSDKYQSRLFVACIKRWPITSLHPFGQLVEELGPIGDIEVETNALLKDCNFSNEDFSESVNKCLPPTPWAIPGRETQPDVRRDLRDQRVFTIDPETAKDLDDALHIVRNDDGTFEVGVHIADVSHFVKPNTPLDREARKRATTVYLVQRAVPMLPPTLSEELCSLNAGSDKLTFSVIFTMTPEGKIVKTWFGKTVINSQVKLAYSDAQEVIEGRPLPEHKITDDAALREGVENDVKALAGIARHLRARRFDNGALRIDNVKVSFRLDEVGMPVDSHEFQRKEANELIEEFMLLANISVAGKIASGLPDQSLLRRHESPIDRRLEAFVARMGRLGIQLDSTSSGALMKSIANITDPSERLTLQHLSTRSMQRAKYFCTGMLDISKYRHYALNVPLYTHFTSPIRRYADIMVHRQLEAVLAAQATSPATEARFPLDAEAVSKVAQTCNIKKEAARLAQEQSQHLFLCHLIADLTKRYGPVIRYGTVIGVLDQAFDVLVSEFGVEKRVHVDQMPTESTVHNEHDNSLQIFWQKGVDVLSYLAQNNSDEHLQRLKASAQHHARMMEAESGQAAGESALFDDDEDEDEAIGGEGDEGAKFKERGPIETEQHRKSADRTPLQFEGLSTENGHCSQTIKELHQVPVCIAADLSKSPPIIKVFAVSPFGQE